MAPITAISPYFLSRHQLTQELLFDMVVHPTANKAYLAAVESYDPERLNLNVIDLSLYPDYKKMQTSYRDVNSSILFGIGHLSCVSSIALLADRNLLYLLVYEQDSLGNNKKSYLTIYNLEIKYLSSKGNPIGDPITYQLPTAGAISDTVVLHPSQEILYISQAGSVLVLYLDAAGLPKDLIAGNPLPSFRVSGNSGLYSLRIREDGTRLYAGGYPNQLYITTLYDNGQPQVPGDTIMHEDVSFPNDLTWGTASDDRIYRTFYFHYTTKAIYRRVGPSEDDYRHANFTLRVWPLDENGDIPVGSAPVLADGLNCDSESFFPTEKLLYSTEPVYFTDQGVANQQRTGGFVLRSYELDAQGHPAKDKRTNSFYIQDIATFDDEEPMMLRLVNDKIPIVYTRSLLQSDGTNKGLLPQMPGCMQVKGHYLVARVEKSVPMIDDSWSVQVVAQLGTTVVGPYPPKNRQFGQQFTITISLDEFLLDPKALAAKRQILITTSLVKGSEVIQQADWSFEYLDGMPSAGNVNSKAIKKQTFFGPKADCLVDSYSYQTGSPAGRFTRFQQLQDLWYTWNAAAFKSRKPLPGTPQSLLIPCYDFSPIVASRAQIESMTEMLLALGINCVLIQDFGYNVFSSLPEHLDYLQLNGITRFKISISDPLENNTEANNWPTKFLVYFDFYLTPEKLTTWVQNVILGMLFPLVPPEALLNFGMNDEYGYRYDILLGEGGALTIEPYHGDFLTAWHAYLQLPLFGLSPADFGAPNWNSVLPLATMPDPYPALDTAGARHNRAIFYWTLRFLQYSVINGFNMTITALKAVYPNLSSPYVNLNTWFGWRAGFPTLALDWFEVGRSRNQMLWSEIVIADNNCWQISFIADIQASAANASHANAQKNIAIGVYIKPDEIGGHPAGSLYKALTFISRNAKVIEWYKLGLVNEFDAWCANTDVYPQIADAMAILTKLDASFYQASPRRGKVALFSSGASMIWDADVNPTQSTYTTDLQGIYAALIQEGHMVDFVDDADISSGLFGKRSYEVLYITAPNISAAAIVTLTTWINNGGVVIATDGAGLFDEYNTASTALSDLMGVSGRKPNRANATYGGNPLPANKTIVAASAQLPVVESGIWLPPVSTLNAPVEIVRYKLDSGETMLTEKSVGAGYCYCFGFLPGLQYLNAGNIIKDFISGPRNVALLDKWRASYRLFPVLPLRIFEMKGKNISKAVILDQKMVEAVVMDSAGETLIVLFNWGNVPVVDLNIQFPNSRNYNHAVNYIQGAVSGIKIKPGQIEFMLGPLQYVEVIKVYYQKPKTHKPRKNQKGQTTIGINKK